MSEEVLDMWIVKGKKKKDIFSKYFVLWVIVLLCIKYSQVFGAFLGIISYFEAT